MFAGSAGVRQPGPRSSGAVEGHHGSPREGGGGVAQPERCLNLPRQPASLRRGSSRLLIHSFRFDGLRLLEVHRDLSGSRFSIWVSNKAKVLEKVFFVGSDEETLDDCQPTTIRRISSLTLYVIFCLFVF